MYNSYIFIKKIQHWQNIKAILKKLISPSDTDFYNAEEKWKMRKWRVVFKVIGKLSLQSGQPDDLIFLWYSQMARLQLLLQLSLHLQKCVPELRVCLAFVRSAALSVLGTLSVVGLHVCLHSLAGMFRRGTTHQARVPHHWVKMQPVHHVVDAANRVAFAQIVGISVKWNFIYTLMRKRTHL